ncbi:sulfatase [Myxococcota bacterium]|nr:sulfatase [Myxococcota bacterium]
MIVALAFFACAASERAAAPPPPDLVVVSVETFRADRARIGQAGSPMPRLSAFAASAQRYEAAWSPAPWTLPSMVSLLTGLSAAEHGVTRGELSLNPEVETLAETLQAAGYETMFFGVNSLFTASRGLEQGFSTYRAWPSLNGNDLQREIERALDARDPKRPLLLWAHYFEPHCPYEAAQPFRGREEPTWGEETAPTLDQAQFDQLGRCFQLTDPGELPVLQVGRYLREYDAELRGADLLLGDLLVSLERRGLKDAVIVVVGDHGESFWEHGDFGHGRTLYEEVLHVPLLVRWPGGAEAGAVTTPVSTAMVPALLRHAAGLEPRPALDGVVLAGTDDEGRALRAGRLGDQKLILDARTGAVTAFDLAADPNERAPLAAPDPTLLDAVRAEAARRPTHPPSASPLAAPVDAQLRALGYKP